MRNTYPKLPLIPDTSGQTFQHRHLNTTVSDVVGGELKHPQASIGVEAFSQGLAVWVLQGNSRN